MGDISRALNKGFKKGLGLLQNQNKKDAIGSKLHANASTDKTKDLTYTLEDHILFYSNENYDPLYQAQQLFTVHAPEEVQRNINHIATIQTNIEQLLTDRVRQHYTSFLKAHDGIRSLEHDIEELQHVIKATQQLIEVGKFRQPESLALFKLLLLAHSRDSSSDVHEFEYS